MRKVFLTGFTLSILYAIPNFYGTSGYFRNMEGLPHGKGHLAFNIYTSYFFENYKNRDTVVKEFDSTLIPVEDRRHWIRGKFGLNYSPFNIWELGARGDFEGRIIEKTDFSGLPRNDIALVAYRGIDVFTKLGTKFFEDPLSQTRISGGILFGLYIPNQGYQKKRETEFIYEYGFAPFIRRWAQFHTNLAADFNLQILTLTGNAGFIHMNKVFEKGDSVIPYVRFDKEDGTKSIRTLKLKNTNVLNWGGGISLALGDYVDLIFDFTGVYFTEWQENLISLTPGIRFKTPGGVNFDFAIDTRLKEIHDTLKWLASTDYFLADFAPDWRFIFQISNVINLLPSPPPPPPPPPITKAKVMGKVTDAKTGEPLGAQISFPGTNLPPVASDPETGIFSVELEPGTYRLHCEKEGYKWKEKVINLKEKEEVIVDFALNKKIFVIITGKIIDNITEKPVGANISVPETDYKTISDPATGIYKLELPPGSYILHVDAEGYVPEDEPVIVKEEVPLVKDFRLKKIAKKGERIRLQNIYFDTGKATIKPESFPILDQVAEFLKANPKAVVEIQGHTDSIGSDSYNLSLSQARAEAVKTYLVTRHGIDPSRLIARGYGETMPIASNASREGRAMNRRVEFVIIESE